MRARILFLFFSILVLCDFSFSQTFYKIPHIQTNDKRIGKVIIDYTLEEELKDVEGAIILQFDKESPDCFYLGYIVYKTGLTDSPPSYYAFVKGKLVLIYTGFERYLNYADESYKDLLKDADGVFPLEGGVIVEPTYWQFNLTKDGYKKNIIKHLPY